MNILKRIPLQQVNIVNIFEMKWSNQERKLFEYLNSNSKSDRHKKGCDKEYYWCAATITKPAIVSHKVANDFDKTIAM